MPTARRVWIANRRSLDEITAGVDDLSRRAAQLLAGPGP
jgi:hypothetical protein